MTILKGDDMRIFTIALALLLLAVGCGEPAKKPAPKMIQVVYLVDGTSNEFSLTYTNETGGTNQEKVGRGWTKKFNAKPGQYVSLSAQNEWDHGDVKVSIKANGKVFQSAEANDEYGIASVNGSLPE
jgi:hypothetical protein